MKMKYKIPTAFALLALAYNACTPIDSTSSDTDSAAVAGLYVLDGTSGYSTRTHDEWSLSATGNLTVSHFTWNSEKQSGCYDSHTTGGAWSSENARLSLTFTGGLSYRPTCDSAWRDTVTGRIGTISHKVRADSLGFDWLDSANGNWHSMLKI